LLENLAKKKAPQEAFLMTRFLAVRELIAHKR
jgi:hypothetical protein